MLASVPPCVMLGVLCARPKPWIIAALSAAAHHRVVENPISFIGSGIRRRHHSTACTLCGVGGGAAAASIWHAILPSGGVYVRSDLRTVKGEGSWNVACDARPARWLHRPDSAWLLFGVCACLAPLDLFSVNTDVRSGDEKINGCDSIEIFGDKNNKSSSDYRVTGVPADGRCLFRAIAHGACLKNGEEAPDETRQRELADELRAQVVEELLRRREESEWFIEGDFDVYVKRIQQPYVWGGEPELLMASHVLKSMISVFMIDKRTGGLTNIAKYGEEYQKDEGRPINVLFHGYGHYDLLESISEQCYQKISA